MIVGDAAVHRPLAGPARLGYRWTSADPP